MTLQRLSAQQKQHNTSLSKMKEYDGLFLKCSLEQLVYRSAEEGDEGVQVHAGFCHSYTHT